MSTLKTLSSAANMDITGEQKHSQGRFIQPGHVTKCQIPEHWHIEIHNNLQSS